MTYTLVATVVAVDGTVSNTATAQAPAGATEADSTDNSATDLTQVTPTADLSITKTDGLLRAAAGRQITYTITVRNAGPSPIDGATVTDTPPSTTQLTDLSWTCVATLGTCGAPNGTGPVVDTISILAAALSLTR